jgi:hypothetical protein
MRIICVTVKCLDDGLLSDYLSSNKTTLCVIEREQFAKYPKVAAASRVVSEEGNRLLISGIKAR